MSCGRTIYNIDLGVCFNGLNLSRTSNLESNNAALCIHYCVLQYRYPSSASWQLAVCKSVGVSRISIQR